MKIVFLIGILILLLLINLSFGRKIISDDLIKGLSKKIFKKVLMMAVIFGIGILITVQLIISSEKADSAIAEQERQLERQQYEEYQAAEFAREVNPFKETFGGVWYPHKPEYITNKDGIPITDYSIHLRFIDEINGEIVISYREGGVERSETLQINYHSTDHPAFIHEMDADIESKDGNSRGGGRFGIEEPRQAYKDMVGCGDCKDFEFRVGEESKLENFPNLVFLNGFYSRTKSEYQVQEENVSEVEVVDADQESVELDSKDPLVPETEVEEPSQNDDLSEAESKQDPPESEVSPLAQRTNKLQGAWKRANPVGEDDHQQTHGVRYIFIKKLDYGSTPAWRFTFETNYYLSTKDFSLTENELVSSNDQSVASKKGPDVTNKTEGFIIKVISQDKISVQYLNHSETDIVTEEFVRVSRNEIEEEFVGIYDALIGE
jgi:hypothetical protein